MIPYIEEQNQHICILSSFDDQKMTITDIGYHMMVIIIGIIIEITQQLIFQQMRFYFRAFICYAV